METISKGLRKWTKSRKEKTGDNKSSNLTFTKKPQSLPEQASGSRVAIAEANEGHAVPADASENQGSVHLADQTGASPNPIVYESAIDGSTKTETKDGRPLWDRAYGRLRDQKPELMEEYERILAKTADVREELSLNETMRAVVDNRVAIMTSRQWKVRIPFRKEEMLVIDLVDKIVGVVLKFKSVGNTLASLDPIYAGIPFAAICYILPLLTNVSEERQRALKGLEVVTDLVDLYSEVENTSLDEKESRLVKKLSEKLENLYFEMLDFLARAACYFDLPTLKRLPKEVLKMEDWGKKLESIKKADEDCRPFANAYYQNEQQMGIQTITDMLRRQEDSNRDLLQKLNLQYNENEKIILWVSRIDVEGAHHQVRAKLGRRYQKTGQWLQPRYDSWIKSKDTPTFLISGSVGTGKSSLISHVIEWTIVQTQGKDAERVAYFYCSGKEGQSTTSADVIRSLIAQLAWSPDGSKVVSSVKSLYEKQNQDNFDPELLANLVSCHRQTIIIIDALDECENHSTLLASLKQVSDRMTSGEVKFFFSSRPNVNWLSKFPAWEKVGLDAVRELTSQDMEAYIRTQIKDPEGRRLLDGTDPELEDKLINTLVDRAQGMFRWVELQLAKFLSDRSGLNNSADVEEALGSLIREVGDPDLDKVYSEIYDMNTKATSSRAIATRAFHWMMCAQRPLSLAELAEVSAADQIAKVKRQVTEQYILQVCSNFIIADSSKMAQFAHLSVREYLQRREVGGIKEYSQQRSHNPVAKTCLSYLMDPDIPLDEIDNFQGTVLGYSVSYWALHWHEAFENRGPNSLGKSYEEFISDLEPNSPFTDWITVLPKLVESVSFETPILSERLQMSTSPMLAACTWGFLEILVNLSKRTDLDFVSSLGEGYMSGLAIAADFGQDDVVQFLLENHAPPTKEALDNAVSRGNRGVVKRLLENGAEINAPNSSGDTVILHAATSGDCSMMALLLDEGADMSAQVSYKAYSNYDMAGSADEYTGCTALHIAAREGNLEMVQLLLEHDASVKPVTFSWSYEVSPLDEAIKNFHEEVAILIMKKERGMRGAAASRLISQLMLHEAVGRNKDVTALRLLRNGADAKAIDEQGRTALHKVGSHASMARLLIKYGADVRTADKSGRTPLHEAAEEFWEESEEVVKVFLENGAVIESLAANQRTPLHEAAKGGHMATMGLLVELRANIGARDDQGRSPLHEACSSSSWSISKITMLLQKGADVNVKDIKGYTPLHVAVTEQSQEGVKVLLSWTGIDPNSKDIDGRTPLSLAMDKRYQEIVELLVAHGGVTWDARGSNRYLWSVIKYGEEELARQLVEIGAISVEEDYYGEGTLLHVAVSAGFLSVAQLLLERGVDVDATTDAGTALHIAVRNAASELIQLLVDKGANINARDEKGYTPLIALVEEDHLNKEVHTTILATLLEIGADINAKDNFENTALHLACLLRKETLVRFLLENGADVSLKDKRGQTALHCATSILSDEALIIVRLLLEHGVDKTAKDNEGKTALYGSFTSRRLRKELEEILGMKYEGSESSSEDRVRRRRVSPRRRSRGSSSHESSSRRSSSRSSSPRRRRSRRRSSRRRDSSVYIRLS